MSKLALTAVMAIVMFGGTSTAQAHLVTKPKGETLKYRLASQTENLAHAKYVCRRGKGDHKRWSCKAVAWLTSERKRTEGALHAQNIESMSPVALGRYLAAKRGWVGYEWDCLYHLWGPLESGWYVYADNPNSDAYGIPQALPGSKMGPGWQHSAFVQIRWGLGYISGRYGSPCAARSYRLANGYY